jgi:hypothetical protein
MMLSLYQHFAYRQFGRSWLILGMATRLALGLQLNRGTYSGSGRDSVTSRECRKRLAWGVFIHDKLHSGGIEEFVAMPKRWMHISAPLNEDDFHREHNRQMFSLSGGVDVLPCDGMGINGYILILMSLRHDILQYVPLLYGRAHIN